MTFVFSSKEKGTQQEHQGATGGIRRCGLAGRGAVVPGSASRRAPLQAGRQGRQLEALTPPHAPLPLARYGKLVLVDLAGSERLKETGNTARDAVRETGAINKSLFTLGQVGGLGGWGHA